MTSLKTSIKTITYLSDIGCLEIQGASLAGRQRQHHQDNVLPHPILHKSEFDFSSKVVKSERRRVRLLRIINNASVGRELRAHYSSGLEE
uniref:Uncharacterized protein n=1 Tax=Escherichia coli TaxID=562 RepID=A0A2H5BZS3_ECOLX|nr:hypothetical protein PCOV6_00178 [Escherichia coli]